jgi:hypothetical protein
MLMSPNKYHTGDLVPDSGIYRVVHSVHRLPHSVTICKGERFPRCAKCADKVVFELIRGIECPFTYEPMHVFELHPEEDERAAGAADTSNP